MRFENYDIFKISIHEFVDMLVKYNNDKLAGIVGKHPEGCVGMLHVFEEYREKEIVKNEEKTVEPTKVAIQENEVPLAEAPVQAETSSQWWVIVLTALVLTAIGFGLYKGMQAKKVQK